MKKVNGRLTIVHYDFVLKESILVLTIHVLTMNWKNNQHNRLLKQLLRLIELINLILLTILCIWFLNQHCVVHRENAISIVWWSPNLDGIHSDIHSVIPTDIKFADINLTGNDRDDKIKLDSVQFLVRELVTTKNSTTGVHLHFGNKSKYWTLIRAIDICEIEGMKTYIPYQNDFWIRYLGFTDRKHKSKMPDS